MADVSTGVTLMDGRLHLYKRAGSRLWQCSTYLGGRNRRQTTKEENLALARAFAEQWYMEQYILERRRRGLALTPELQRQAMMIAPEEAAASVRLDRRRRPPADGPTFREAVTLFLRDTAMLAAGERSERYLAEKQKQLKNHLVPFFGAKALSEITAGLIQDYRVHRATSRKDPKTGEPLRPARSTLHQEMVTLRQILKAAHRQGWIAALPDMSAPYRKSSKVSHRAWFSPEEYKQLYQASRERAKSPKRERWREAGETLHDYILFMVNTGLRPDEALRLEYRDVAIVTDAATGERILEIEVRGKRGVGFCKSMPGAVTPFSRLRSRSGGGRQDKVFKSFQRELFNTLLDELGLRVDREGQRRTAYSLRHTYICLRLIEGADIYQVAKNCRTSAEMIETFYASHIKDRLDAAAINVRKAKPGARAAREGKAAQAA